MQYELIIEPGRAERNYWRDLWRFRELMYFLAYRDILVRYKQTVIGVIWALLKPALTMLVFVAFRRVAKLSASDVPDPILVYAALMPWQFFSTALTEASGSLIGNANLITKVYFPRLIIPASSVITSFVDFAISFGLMLVLMAFYQYMPSWQIIFLPLFIILSFFTAFGIGLYLTALNVKYRDFRYIIPFIVQFGLYISPVGFSSNVVPEQYRFWYNLNPMVGVIDGFRWCILGESELNTQSVLSAVLISGLFTWIGVWYFRKMERNFADVI